MDTISVNGHDVPAHEADRFFSAKDGRPLTDAEWDESKRRRAAAAEVTEPTWEPIADDEEAEDQ